MNLYIVTVSTLSKNFLAPLYKNMYTINQPKPSCMNLYEVPEQQTNWAEKWNQILTVCCSRSRLRQTHCRGKEESFERRGRRSINRPTQYRWPLCSSSPLPQTCSNWPLHIIQERGAQCSLVHRITQKIYTNRANKQWITMRKYNEEQIGNVKLFILIQSQIKSGCECVYHEILYRH